jgi:hypothetical protein
MAQCAEGEDQEQHAEEGDADGRYRQQEHELQRHVRGDLEHGEIVVGESVTDAGFRQHGEGADDEQAAEPEQRGNVDRDDAVKGVEQQDEGAERVAGDLAEIHLAALPHPARPHQGRSCIGHEGEIRGLSGIPLGKGRRSRAHGPANGGCQPKNLRGKPLGLVSFETESTLCSAGAGTSTAQGICWRLGIVCDAVEPKQGFGRHMS